MDELPDEREAPADLRLLGLDDARFEALVARIEAATAPALERRALAVGLQQVLARAAWPALIAAAASVLVAIGLGRSAGAGTEPGLATTGIETIVPGGTSDVAWIEEQRAPTDADLAQAIGLGAGQ